VRNLVVGLFLIATAVAGCGPEPSPTVATRAMTITIPVPPAGKAVVGAAEEVFADRLRTLGIGNFTVNTGDAMTFRMAVPLTVDTATVEAVLRRPGVIQFVPWPADSGAPAPDTVVPAGLQPLFDDPSQFRSASITADDSGQPALDITFGAIGREAIATYTTEHVGGYLPLVLDGIVLTAPIIQSPITDGVIRLTAPFPAIDPESIPLVALAALITSGPLPAGWTAPP
jgi:preprotein translocase subunit SecD